MSSKLHKYTTFFQDGRGQKELTGKRNDRREKRGIEKEAVMMKEDGRKRKKPDMGQETRGVMGKKCCGRCRGLW